MTQNMPVMTRLIPLVSQYTQCSLDEKDSGYLLCSSAFKRASVTLQGISSLPALEALLGKRALLVILAFSMSGQKVYPNKLLAPAWLFIVLSNNSWFAGLSTGHLWTSESGRHGWYDS